MAKLAQGTLNLNVATNKPEKPMESKSDKFIRLATQRTINALDKIRLLHALSSSQYEYSPEQVEQIINALTEAVNAVAQSFSKTKATRKQFSFNS